jgi:hypothetical protein
MARQIGPIVAEPLAIALQARLKLIDSRLRSVESRLAPASTGHQRAADRRYVSTACGRELSIGRLTLGDAAGPAMRVILDVGDCPGCNGSNWVGLTADEARELAAVLVAQACAVEAE